MPTQTPTKTCADFSFPRRARLLSSRDFQQVFKRTDYRSADSYLAVLARKNHQNRPRLGLAISKRAIKTAVGRNRIKRLVRECFRHHQTQLGGLDIVVLSRSGATQASNQQLRASLQAHWQRLKKQSTKQKKVKNTPCEAR